MNSTVTVLLLLLCCSCCFVFVTADLLNLPSIDSLASQGTSTYMEHHSNTPQFDRQYDTAPTGTHTATNAFIDRFFVFFEILKDHFQFLNDLL